MNLKQTRGDLQFNADRFWQKVELPDLVGGDECWLWIASCNQDGYGRFWLQGSQNAHYISYRLCLGDVPEELCVLHNCDTPSCVNPQHLFLGTRDVNNKDRALKRRSAVGEQSGRSKLTEKEVIEIRERYVPDSITQQELAKHYNVSNHQISMIVRRKSWIHLGNRS